MGTIFSKNNNMGSKTHHADTYGVEELQVFTDNYQHKLGEGAYGTVFKGTCKDGKPIAVKILKERPGENQQEEFKRELKNLKSLNHPNIIQLVGFCYQIGNQSNHQIGAALCLEYAPGGSLKQHILDEGDGLDWQTRYGIIKGICEGLNYLYHHHPSGPILHRDLKPDNILLDDDMVPKIADFGLSKICNMDEVSTVTKNHARSPRYAPPEFRNRSILSKTFDMYSLGVIIMEIVAGPAVYDAIDDMPDKELTEHARTKWRGRLDETQLRQVTTCLELALICAHVQSKERPGIKCVLEKLNEVEKMVPVTFGGPGGGSGVGSSSFGASGPAQGSRHRSNQPNRNRDVRSRNQTVKNISCGLHRMEEDQRLLKRILDGAQDPRDLSFELLKHITNDFSEERKIGQGGFGEVYMGVLGERIVAVKRIHINKNNFDDKLFRREVASLMKCNHRNVVQFLGVCSGGYQKLVDKDGSGEFIWANVLERLLCFRYISNGSLDRHITDELRGLEWEARYEIMTGICKGLLYLHEKQNIIHMDLRPANILLDYKDEKYMVPKITDFGLSRPNKNSHSLGQRYGTLEYMAPEYREESKITQSCDIYSLGLIIIELVTGCKDVPSKDNVLRRWRHRWKKPPTQLQYQQVTRCMDVAGRCRKKNPEHRPTISWIINFLGESESTYSQINPFLDEDDMLQINPLELRLPFEIKNEISCTIELTNETHNCIIAFRIQIPSTLYSVKPDKGIVRPESRYSVKITVKAQDVGERDHADKFIVQSMKVEASEAGLGDEDIIERMFEKTGRFIDEVDLMVVYESTKSQENFKRSEDTNAPEKTVKNITCGMEEEQRLLERILDGAENPRDLPFALLKDITNDFSEERKIGQGGFGDVYKGVLGERIVAVKRIHINEHTFDDKLFHREVTSLMKCNHRNVIQFLGVCSGGYQKPIDKDGSGEFIWATVLERLLCFRYISNGSLDRHITDELRGLEWETRYEIITGICKGLLYLHEEKNIIHMNLKPANILLDHQDEKYMVPKITDFGLSRSNENSHSLGQRYGTLEYMAPEYREENKTTQSCDIYSLGLIIIELVTGCKDVPNNKDNVLRRWRHRWQKPPTQLQYQQVTRCIDIAGQCRRKNPKDRPSIWAIINFLSQSESTYCQISPSLDKDDMLRINPLEVRLPFELKNEISCTIELTNETRNCIIAFNIQIPSTVYNAQPDKGIVRPESKSSVKITLKARDVGERDHTDKFIVQSMKVEASEGLGDEDIIERMFEKTGRFIDEVDLMVVYESTKSQENFKRNEDTNAPAEEVP